MHEISERYRRDGWCDIAVFGQLRDCEIAVTCPDFVGVTPWSNCMLMKTSVSIGACVPVQADIGMRGFGLILRIGPMQWGQFARAPDGAAPSLCSQRHSRDLAAMGKNDGAHAIVLD